MNIKDVRRQLYKVQNITGLAEKTEVLTDELQILDKHVEFIRDTCQVADKKVRNLLRTEGPDSDKKIKKLPEHILGASMYEVCTDINWGLSSVLLRCAMLEQHLAWEVAKFDELVEREVLEPMKAILENDIPALQKLRRTLSKLTTDMDIAQNRYTQAHKQHSQPGSSVTDAKLQSLKDEMMEAQKQVDKTRVHYSTDMQTFISREAEVGKYLAQLLLCQKSYHENCVELLNQSVPLVQETIDAINQPVFGIALCDHVKQANVEVSVVISECVTWLADHVGEEGIFRLSGNAATIKSIKAAMDIGVPLAEQTNTDAHSVAGVLKQYLRELPEPLLTFDLYSDWMKTAQAPVDERCECVKAVLKKLPTVNYKNLSVLVEFLCKLAEHTDTNKMTPSNLGIVIGPNLLWSPDLTANIHSANVQSWLVEMFIVHAADLFPEIKCSQVKLVVISDPTPDSPTGRGQGHPFKTPTLPRPVTGVPVDASPVSADTAGVNSLSPSNPPLLRTRSKRQAPAPPPQCMRMSDVRQQEQNELPAVVFRQSSAAGSHLKRKGTIQDSPISSTCDSANVDDCPSPAVLDLDIDKISGSDVPPWAVATESDKRGAGDISDVKVKERSGLSVTDTTGLLPTAGKQ